MAPKIRLKISKVRKVDDEPPQISVQSPGKVADTENTQTSSSSSSSATTTTTSGKRTAEQARSPAKRLKLVPLPSAKSPNYAASPAYGGRSPSVSTNQSPGYFRGGMSPVHQPDAKSLGGILTVPILQMLKELAPAGYIEKQLIIVSKDTTVGSALALLSKHKILAVPVVDTEGKYVDMVEMLDLVKFIVSLFTTEEILKTKTPKRDEVADAATWHALEVKGKEALSSTRISEVLANRAGADGSVVSHISASASVQELLELFLTSRTQDGRRVHRVVLLNEDGNLKALVSQSDMLRYLYTKEAHVKAASPSAKKTLRELKLDSRKVVVTNRTSSLLYAFHKMAKYNAHSLSVIEPSTSQIVRHLAASDLRGMNSFPVLLSSIEGYGDPQKPVTLTPDMTLWETLAKCATKKLHRAAIVDSMERPYSIVSITNILGMLTSGK